jgi:hypothetical protein
MQYKGLQDAVGLQSMSNLSNHDCYTCTLTVSGALPWVGQLCMRVAARQHWVAQ